MIPANFEYYRATSVDEAIDLMVEHGMDAKILAGGHSLLPAMKLRLNQPGVLIDIGRIDGLKGISKGDGELIIGASVTHHELATSTLISSSLSLISEAAESIGDVQVRNVGTIGGSLAHADPAADWPAVLIAANATIDVRGTDGNRSITADDFFTDFFTTALEDNELITAIRIPFPPDGTTSSYQKFMQPASRFALVGCAIMVTQSDGVCERVSVAFTGVSEAAFRDEGIEGALLGKALNEENIATAANKAAQGMSILSDHFASEEYRGHLARVYAKRAMMAVRTT